MYLTFIISYLNLLLLRKFCVVSFRQKISLYILTDKSTIITNNMEEEDTRRLHRNKGRFGIRTNKTLRYNKDEAWRHRKENLDTIVVLDKDDPYYRMNDNGFRELIGISLNARKNWEIIQNKNNRNSLNSSQDDLDVDYGPRIVVLDEDARRNKVSRGEEYKHQVVGPSSEYEDEPEIETVSGTNRKGFFVKEKRKKGKKGVLKPESKGNRGRSKSFNNKSDSSSSESDSDSAIDEPEKDERIIVVSNKPKHPDYVRHADLPACGCRLCTGEEKNPKAVQRREVVKSIDDL